MSFTILASRRVQDAIEIDVHVPADCPYFRGHFPRYPVLPSIALLELVTRLAAAHTPLGDAPRALRALRLRGTITPEATLSIRLEAGDAALAFRVALSGGPCAQGRLLYGALDPPAFASHSAPRPEHAAGTGSAPPLPHAGPARMVHAVLERDEDSVLCRARVPDASPFQVDGRVPALVAIELAAQASAAHGEGEPGGGNAAAAAGRGFVVGVREAWFGASSFAGATEFRVHARQLSVAPPLRNYAAGVYDDAGTLVAAVQLATWVPADSRPES